MQHGFSLVELSIVLVILGLLTGGILSGQSLIRAAELRSVSTDYQKYVSAIRSFQDRYRALPGDMSTATRFWGAADGNDGIGTDCVATTVTPAMGTVTCNGNGDGVIGSTNASESAHAWRHLANAGLVEGFYNGYFSLNDTPKARINSARWAFTTYALLNTSIPNPAIGASVLMLVAQTGSWPTILTPEEAWNIDIKLDDGKPGTGRIMGLTYAPMPPLIPASGCTTATATGQTTGVEYQLSYSGKGCALAFGY